MVIEASYNVYYAAFAALLSAMSVGNAIGYNSPALIDLRNDTILGGFNITIQDESNIASAFSLGGLIGGLFGGSVSQLGRKKAIFCYGIPLAGAWYVMLAAKTIFVVLVSRFLTGLVSGMICVTTPTYVAEIATKHNRGRLGAGFQVFLTFGVFVMAFLGIFTSGKFNEVITWRHLALIGMLPPILMTLSMLGMPESPAWLVSQYGRGSTKPTNTLCRIRTMRSDLDLELDELQEITQREKDENQLWLSCEQLRSRYVLRPLLLSVGLVLFQQLSGISAIYAFQTDIISDAGMKNPQILSALLSFAQVLATIFSACIVDCVGRRKLLLASALGLAVSLTTFGTVVLLHNKIPQLEWLAPVALFVYLISYSLGFGPIPWLMIPELTPIQIRTPISAISTAFFWFLNFLVAYTFKRLTTGLTGLFQEEYDYQHAATLYIYAAISGLSILFVIFFLPETKGKSFDEIHREYNKQHKDQRSATTSSGKRKQATNVVNSIGKSVKSKQRSDSFDVNLEMEGSKSDRMSKIPKLKALLTKNTNIL